MIYKAVEVIWIFSADGTSKVLQEVLPDLKSQKSKSAVYYVNCVREPFKNVLADFVRQGGTPPHPYPLNGKSFFQKTLSGNGGYPLPPLNGKSAKLFRKFCSLLGLKMMFLH